MATDTQQFAVRQALQSLTRLSEQIDRSTTSAGAQPVHDLRVGIRRASQATAVCKPFFSAKDLRKLRHRLKKLMVAAGAVRDCDVAMKLVAKWSTPETVQLRSKLRAERKQRQTALVRQLKKWQHHHMTDAGRWAIEGTPDSIDEGIHDVACRYLGRLATDFQKRGDEASSGNAAADDLHRFRILTKKLRYTLELFQPFFGPSIDREFAILKRAGGLLGDINDCVTTAELVERLDRNSRIEAWLKRRQERRTEKFHRYWKAHGNADRIRSWIKRLGQKRKPMGRSESSNTVPRRARAGPTRVTGIAER